MIQTTEQAIAVIQNTRLSEAEREEGIHFVRQAPSAQGIEVLVETLRDNDHGVRFAAAHALAYVGDAAMPTLLRALAQPDTDVVLRKGATIVISESTSPKVRQQGQALLNALKGSQAGIATMEAAIKLMPSFE
jgi:HEAT repeat protein